MAGIIGRKVGMTSIFDAEGKNIPCTVVEAGPCIVTQVKTEAIDGYNAVQIAFGEKKDKHASAGLKGHVKKANTTPKRKFVEFTDFEKEFGRLPTLYAAQGYDTAMLIDSAVKKVKGRVEDKAALRAALQAADFKSVRGNFKFNKNQFPIQDYYLRVVRTDERGRITNRLMGKILTNHEDSFASQCKMPGM